MVMIYKKLKDIFKNMQREIIELMCIFFSGIVGIIVNFFDQEKQVQIMIFV